MRRDMMSYPMRRALDRIDDALATSPHPQFVLLHAWQERLRDPSQKAVLTAAYNAIQEDKGSFADPGAMRHAAEMLEDAAATMAQTLRDAADYAEDQTWRAAE